MMAVIDHDEGKGSSGLIHRGTSGVGKMPRLRATLILYTTNQNFVPDISPCPLSILTPRHRLPLQYLQKPKFQCERWLKISTTIET